MPSWYQTLLTEPGPLVALRDQLFGEFPNDPAARGALAPPIRSAPLPEFTPLSEQASIELNLLRQRLGRAQVCVFTSAEEESGAREVSFEFAREAAADGERTVAWLDTAPAHDAPIGDAPIGAGFYDWLAGRAQWPDAAQRSDLYPGMSWIHAGSASPFAARALDTLAWHERLLQLRRAFELIVLHAPAVAGSAAAAQLAASADATLLVVRHGVTSRPALDSALARLGPERVTGFVWNAS